MGVGIGASAEQSAKTSKLFRKLSNVLLINSLLFSKASATEQTQILAESSGVPVLFVSNFSEISDRRKIRDRLLAGEDVSMELEFNGIELSDEDRRVLSLVGPVLAKIGTIKPSYPWKPEKPVPSIYQLSSDSIQNTNGYRISVPAAKKVWDKASKFWAAESKACPQFMVDTYHNSRSVAITPGGVAIGCQNINRSTVEALARHYGWEPCED